MKPKSFYKTELVAQQAFFQAQFPDAIGFGGSAYRLERHKSPLNLAPAIREAAPDYFRERSITWHLHANHALSSQVCCLNFLMPLAQNPGLLSKLVGLALGIPAPEMLPVEAGPSGRPWFIGFEWIGRRDYLNEGGSRKSRSRGSNATSADAIIRFRNGGKNESLLVEWKYTETYGPPIGEAGNETRKRRYEQIAFAPDGPIRSDLGLGLSDFFYEPFYQLLRQQMLAFQMQREREDGTERVRVLHIAPVGNTALRRVTAPALRKFGEDAFSVFMTVLTDGEAFVSMTTKSIFEPLIALHDPLASEWASYLASRYTFLGRHAENADTGPTP